MREKVLLNRIRSSGDKSEGSCVLIHVPSIGQSVTAFLCGYNSLSKKTPEPWAMCKPVCRLKNSGKQNLVSHISMSTMNKLKYSERKVPSPSAV